MKQQVDITLKLSLWLDAKIDEDEIVTHVRASLPKAFGEELTSMQNPVDIIEVQQEAKIYGTNEPETVQPLPPDPEGRNDKRAAIAGAIVVAFIAMSGADDEGAVGDLLGNLMHWCDRNNYDFDAALERARGHYEAETSKEVA